MNIKEWSLGEHGKGDQLGFFSKADLLSSCTYIDYDLKPLYKTTTPLQL